MKQICILGEGAWGTAIASVLAHNGHRVTLWCNFAESVEIIQKTRINERYLPEIILGDRITVTHDISQALSGAHYVFEAIPVKYLRCVLEKMRHAYTAQQQWVCLSKGIEKETLYGVSQLVCSMLNLVESPLVLSGPSFAHGVARQEITGVVLAGHNAHALQSVNHLISNHYFKTELSSDVVGVQLCGALKNVLTLGMGIIQGAGHTDNARALFFTRALHEIALLVEAAGGKKETVYGLAGVGDAMLTACGAQSKNLLVGKRLGAGQSLDTILTSTGYIPEGVDTAFLIEALMQKYSVDLPLLFSVYRVIHHHYSSDYILQVLRK